MCSSDLRSHPDSEVVDTQLYCNPVSYHPTGGNGRKLTKPDPYSGFILSFNPCRPTSEGKIEIRSRDPKLPPRIFSRSLATEDDRSQVVAMARLIGRLQETRAIQSLLSHRPEMDLPHLSDDELLEDFRARCGTVYHPCGTCRMGRDSQHAVVDPDLKVHGIENLRVIDASIFPNITSANTNAPTIMVAHQGAKKILRTHR